MHNPLSRRELLGGLTTGAATIWTLNNNFSRDNDTTKIPYITRYGEVIRWKEVPTEWYDHYNDVDRARERLLARVSNISDVVGVSLTTSESFYGDRRGFSPKLYLTREFDDEKIPDEIDDYSIEWETVDRPLVPLDGCVNTGTFDEIPGGVHIGTEQFDSNEPSGGTTCFRRVDNDNSNEYILTANHVLGPWYCSNAENNDAYQGDDLVGNVVEADENLDAALVNVTNVSKSLENEIKTDWMTWTVSGTYTEEAIGDKASDEDLVRSMGIVTGETQGRLIDHKVTHTNHDCIDLDGHGVEVVDEDGNAVIGRGDSGGPIYDLESFGGSQYAVLVGLNALGTTELTVNCWGNDIDAGSALRGPAMYHIHNEFNISGA